MKRNDDSSNSNECEIKRRRVSDAEPLEITLLFEVSSDSEQSSTSDSSSDSSSSSSSSSSNSSSSSSSSTSSFSSIENAKQKREPKAASENIKQGSKSTTEDTKQKSKGSKETPTQCTKDKASGSKTENNDQIAIQSNSKALDTNPSGSNAFNQDQFEESAIQSAIDEHGLHNNLIAVPSPAPFPLSSASDDSLSNDSNENNAPAVERTSDYNSSSSEESNHLDFMEAAIAVAIQKKGLLPHSVEMTPNG